MTINMGQTKYNLFMWLILSFFRMVDAKKKLEEELRRRREAETARLAENERQKQLELDREKEEQQK